jgi:molecular chaperone GrpE
MERRIDGNAGPPEPARAASSTTGAPDTPAPRAPAAQPEPELPAGEPEAPVGPTADATDAPATATDEPASEGQAPGEQPPTLGDDLDKLAAKAQKADEYLELAQRTKADFENYRKRASREAAAAQDRGVAKLAKELLPAVDNLDRALGAALQNSNGDDLVSGIKLVHADVIAALARVGIEPYSPEGDRFDPTFHEAIAQQPFEGAEPGTVVEVYQRGYRLGDSVLRPARVVVAG